MEQAEPAADRLPVRLGWYAALAAVTVAYLAQTSGSTGRT